MDPGALGKELPADNPLETAISSTDQRVDHVGGQPMETKNSKKQALAKELRTLADELLKESWKNSKGPTVPTPGTLIATYVRLKTEFEEIVAVEKQYSPGKVMAPIEDEEMAPGGMRSPGELHKVKNNGLLP